MITVAEKTRSGGAFTRTISYVVIGTDTDDEMTESEAIEAVVGDTPEEYEGLLRQDASISAWHVTPTSTIAIIDMQWGEVESGGGSVGSPPTGDASYEFSYQAQTQHINYALSTTAYGTDAPDFGDKINVNPDGEVLGIDLPAGNTTNGWRLTVPSSFLDSSYESTVEAMMGSVNSGTFKGRAAGTLRFVSVQSQLVSGGNVSLSWGFQYSPNRTGLTIGGISSINIGGHQVWWQLDEKVPDTTGKKIIVQPRAIYVHSVFPTADFSALGF